MRLTPPDDMSAGTVLLVRAGIEIVDTGEAEIGNVSSFGSPVHYQAWVWKQGLDDSPVPGTVSFSAIELTRTVSRLVRGDRQRRRDGSGSSSAAARASIACA